MKIKNKFLTISNIVCVLLLLALMATQFLPFWNCVGCKNHDDGMISISEYLWHPKNHTPVTNSMTDVYKSYFGPDIKDENGKTWKFEANDVITTPILIVIALVLCVIFMITKFNTILPTLAACVGGAAGMYGYLTNLALESGNNWVMHLVVAGIVTAVSAVFLIVATYKLIRKYI